MTEETARSARPDTLVHEFVVDLAETADDARLARDAVASGAGDEPVADTPRRSPGAPEDRAPGSLRRLLPEPGDVDADALLREYRRLEGLRAVMIASVDGASDSEGTSRELGAPADRWHLDLLRGAADVVLVGRGTLTSEGYGPLRVSEATVRRRRDLGLSDHPVLAVLSPSLALTGEEPFLQPAPGVPRPLVITCAPEAGQDTEAWERRCAELRARADVLVCEPSASRPGEERSGATGLRPLDMRRRLVDLGLTRQLSEGGPRVLGDLVAADALDEICLTLSPLLLGAGPHRIVAGPDPRDAGRGPIRRPLELRSLLAAGSMLVGRWSVQTAGA